MGLTFVTHRGPPGLTFRLRPSPSGSFLSSCSYLETLDIYLRIAALRSCTTIPICIVSVRTGLCISHLRPPPARAVLRLFNSSPNAVEQLWPALRQRVAITVWKEAKGGVTERDQRPAVDFLEPVLHVRSHGE